MSTTESLYNASSREGVLVFSVASKRVSHDFDHDHEHENDHHTTTRFNPTRRRVGSLPQGHSGLWGTPVGPGRTPTVHRCPKGKAVGGPQLVPRQTTDRQTTSLETNVLSASRRQDKRAVQQPGADSHLESYSPLSFFHFFIFSFFHFSCSFMFSILFFLGNMCFFF